MTASPLLQKQANSQTPSRVAQRQLKVFFPRDPRIEEDFTRVEPVLRTTSSQSLARVAIEQLIAGPTSRERTRGLIGTIRLTGSSNCGRDFTLSINNGVARLKFCKTFIYGGVGDVARTKSSINATLLQFSNIKSVIILDKNGKCWADDSGENTCLRSAQN
jgi:spore germination protein GerM